MANEMMSSSSSNNNNRRTRKGDEKNSRSFHHLSTTSRFSLTLLFFFALSILERTTNGIIVEGFVAVPSCECRNKVRRSLSSQLYGKLSWSGDSRASMDWDNAPIELVQEWLQTPEASDLPLMGVDDATPKKQHHQQTNIIKNVWNARQPRINFLGIDLVPIFVNEVHRRPPESVTVSILEATTEISEDERPSAANRAVAGLLEKSTFMGKSKIRAHTKSSTSGKKKTTIVSVDLVLTMQLSLPALVLLPPGFNSLGSQIIRQTGKTRTKRLLENLETSYQVWATNKMKQAKESEETATKEED